MALLKIDLRREMCDFRKECMDFINKKTEEILNILQGRMNVQAMSSTDDRIVSVQPNRVVPDHRPGFWTTPPMYVTRPYVATYPPQNLICLDPRMDLANPIILGKDHTPG